MSRRVSLPGADELFRTTGDGIDADRRGDAATTRETGTPERDGSREGGHDRSALEPLQAAVDAATRALDEGRESQRDERHERVGLTAVPDGGNDPAQASSQGGQQGAAQLGERTTGPRRTAVRRRPRVTGERHPSGRERHDEKITVYVSAEELLDLEHARLGLRGDHGLAVDRGRIVREALAVVLADFDAKGEASILVRRLSGR